jgi:hypothetical protein
VNADQGRKPAEGQVTAAGAQTALIALSAAASDPVRPVLHTWDDVAELAAQVVTRLGMRRSGLDQVRRMTVEELVLAATAEAWKKGAALWT